MPTQFTTEIKDQFISLATRLSPENLHCDGEITPAQAKKKLVQINREWKNLEKKIGRTVTEQEVWLWVF